MLYQAWRNCAFLHWGFDPDAVRPHIPPAFELDMFEGKAWVGLISFRMPSMRGGFLPPIPGLRSAAETHLRTYVRGPDGRRGIWMLSLDIDPITAALTGRFGFALPYWWTSMSVERTAKLARYRVRRRGAEGQLDLDLSVGAPLKDADLGALDHFLTARWVLYSGAGPVRAALLTEHPRWRFRRVSVRRVEESFTKVSGLPSPESPPLVHFSDGVDARIGWPRPFPVIGAKATGEAP